MNEIRKEKGLNSLTWNKSLELSAMLRAKEVSKNYDYYCIDEYGEEKYHCRISNGKDFYTVNELSLRENFHFRQNVNATDFHHDFVASPSHLENMLVKNIKFC